MMQTLRRAALIMMAMAAILIAFGIFTACYNAAPYEPVSCWGDSATVRKDTTLQFRARICASRKRPT
jgi:hypothetical protein